MMLRKVFHAEIQSIADALSKLVLEARRSTGPVVHVDDDARRATPGESPFSALGFCAYLDLFGPETIILEQTKAWLVTEATYVAALLSLGLVLQMPAKWLEAKGVPIAPSVPVSKKDLCRWMSSDIQGSQLQNKTCWWLIKETGEGAVVPNLIGDVTIKWQTPVASWRFSTVMKLSHE